MSGLFAVEADSEAAATAVEVGRGDVEVVRVFVHGAKIEVFGLPWARDPPKASGIIDFSVNAAAASEVNLVDRIVGSLGELGLQILH